MTGYNNVYKVSSPIMETERLWLVEPTIESIGMFYDNIKCIDAYFKGFSEVSKTRESFINRIRRDSLKQGERHFIIKEKETNNYIGQIWIFDDNELGWGLCESARGKGYCFEAAKCITDYLIKAERVQYVYAKAFVWNTASINVMKKLCMTEMSRKITNTSDGRHNEVISYIVFGDNYSL